MNNVRKGVLKDDEENVLYPVTETDCVRVSETVDGGNLLCVKDVNGFPSVGASDIKENDIVKKPSGGVDGQILQKDSTTPSGTAWVDPSDGGTAVNPFKGWWPDIATLKTAHTATPGDSAYVKDAGADTWSIYIYDSTASSDEYWVDSGTDVDTSNVQTFASGQEVNEVNIVNNLTTGGEDDVLSAEQGRLVYALNGYYVCDTTGNVQNKSVNITGYTPINGGSIKIKFAHKNTAALAKLSVNGTNEVTLYYNGRVAGINNTWVDNEVVELYYYNGAYYAFGVDNVLSYDNYPYYSKNNAGPYDDCIMDLSVDGNIDYSIGLLNLSISSGKSLIRICALDANGNVDTTKGNSGIVIQFISPIGSGIEKVNASVLSDSSILSASATINWSKYPASAGNYTDSTTPRAFNPLVFNKNKIGTTVQSVFGYTPAANEVVWSNKTYFPQLAWLKDFVVNAKLNHATGYDFPVCLSAITFTNGGRMFITFSKAPASGNVPLPNDNTTLICSYDNGSSGHWNVPTADNGGHRFEVLQLNEKNSSGVSGWIKVDWSVVPIDWSTPPTSATQYRQFNVLNSILSTNVMHITLNGSKTVSFTIDGVDALIKTSNKYTEDGTPDWLMIISHGNGMGDSLLSAMPGSNGNESWYLEHGISLAVIRTQDEESTPYTTNATGWGNSVCIARTIKLYNYLMEHYNFKRTVILAGESMGGCTMGALAYKKPFPIAFCLGVGPVPGVKIMFQNSSSTYKESIRAAYGMNPDGSDDANIADFVKGYDWYDMGLVNDSANLKKKVCYPNFYMYYGNDPTFRNNFGGTTQYQEIVDAFLAAGSYSMMAQAGTTDTDAHATPKVYAKAITDGVFERELGIV